MRHIFFFSGSSTMTPPLFVLLFSSIFLGERLSQNEYLGIGLLVFSAILVSFRKSELRYMALSPALLLILFLDS